MRRVAFPCLLLAALLAAISGRFASAEPLSGTQLNEFFKWVKAGDGGLEFEMKLGRGFSVHEELPRRGPVWFLQFGKPLEVAYTTGALKITPQADAQGPYFEAQCFDANNFNPTSPRNRYVLRVVPTPNGKELEIEPETGT